MEWSSRSLLRRKATSDKMVNKDWTPNNMDFQTPRCFSRLTTNFVGLNTWTIITFNTVNTTMFIPRDSPKMMSKSSGKCSVGQQDHLGGVVF